MLNYGFNFREKQLLLDYQVFYGIELERKKNGNRSQSICRIVSVYRVLPMQGGGHADVLMYFK